MTSDMVSLLNDLLGQGLRLKASDIHIEPHDSFVSVRYRVDGLLQYGPKIDKHLQTALISRVKVMVNLDIAESRLPQDGRGKFENVDLRISTIPTIFGEKIVIRLLEYERTLRPLEELGMEKEDLKLYRQMISKKSGIILVTGPTGSGKTTTLYATLKELNYKEYNITTIEDPVEYQLYGINQIQVNYKTGLTFAAGLRSILRQDPDVILIGEIRDLETARIAIQAALTGHLVFSTLHTNDAASAVTRLTEMGIEPYLVSATLAGVVAQRLCRKIGGGRIGIFEIMQAGKKEFRTLLHAGEEKIRQGLMSREELARVIYWE